MAKSATQRELHSESFPIEQRRPLEGDVVSDASEIVRADADIMNDETITSLAFNEEAVTIRLEPSADTNAPTAVFCAVNGRGIEIWSEAQRKWIIWLYAPIGQTFTTKRKYVEVLARSKLDKVTTDYGTPGDERPINRIRGNTTAYQTFSVIHDPNPKGPAWLSELRRRYF